jgi:PEP-CTERM motif
MGYREIMKMLTVLAAIICIVGYGGVAQAQLAFTVTPGDLAGGATFLNGQGGVPFGYDHDQPRPIGSFDPGAPGYGSGCFYSDVQGSAAGGGRDYTSFRLSPKDIFGLSDVTIGDLDYISYWTKNTDLNLIDWQMKIYTESATNWYGRRFNFHRPLNPDNNWHKSSTGGALTLDWIYDKDTGGSIHYGPGAYSLGDARSTYGGEKILFMDIIAGYSSSSPPVYSYLDGVEIGLTDVNGTIASMNLEPVPEPSVLILLGTGLVGLVAFRRKIKK